jgi:hypothetical protein
VVSIDDGKIIFDKGEIVRNGAALHLDQGIAVTSHASQAKTVDKVIFSVPVRAFSQANEAQFYVSMSRARFAMHVFTDSKVALRDAVTRPSKRLSSWEVLNVAEKDRGLKAELHRQREPIRVLSIADLLPLERVQIDYTQVDVILVDAYYPFVLLRKERLACLFVGLRSRSSGDLQRARI